MGAIVRLLTLGVGAALFGELSRSARPKSERLQKKANTQRGFTAINVPGPKLIHLCSGRERNSVGFNGYVDPSVPHDISSVCVLDVLRGDTLLDKEHVIRALKAFLAQIGQSQRRYGASPLDPDSGSSYSRVYVYPNGGNDGYLSEGDSFQDLTVVSGAYMNGLLTFRKSAVSEDATDSGCVFPIFLLADGDGSCQSSAHHNYIAFKPIIFEPFRGVPRRIFRTNDRERSLKNVLVCQNCGRVHSDEHRKIAASLLRRSVDARGLVVPSQLTKSSLKNVYTASAIANLEDHGFLKKGATENQRRGFLQRLFYDNLLNTMMITVFSGVISETLRSNPSYWGGWLLITFSIFIGFATASVMFMALRLWKYFND